MAEVKWTVARLEVLPEMDVNLVVGVTGNVTSTQFDIVWTETGTAAAQVYMWEAQ